MKKMKKYEQKRLVFKLSPSSKFYFIFILGQFHSQLRLSHAHKGIEEGSGETVEQT